jgi:hypothetical protein
VEDLEQRNVFLQRHASALLEENERLKAQLSKFLSAGNDITNEFMIPSGISPPSSTIASSSPSAALQPEKEYLDFKESCDLIQGHWLYKCGQIRIEDVYQRLKEDIDVTSHDGTQRKVDILNAIHSCPAGSHFN